MDYEDSQTLESLKIKNNQIKSENSIEIDLIGNGLITFLAFIIQIFDDNKELIEENFLKKSDIENSIFHPIQKRYSFYKMGKLELIDIIKSGSNEKNRLDPLNVKPILKYLFFNDILFIEQKFIDLKCKDAITIYEKYSENIDVYVANYFSEKVIETVLEEIDSENKFEIYIDKKYINYFVNMNICDMASSIWDLEERMNKTLKIYKDKNNQMNKTLEFYNEQIKQQQKETQKLRKLLSSNSEEIRKITRDIMVIMTLFVTIIGFTGVNTNVYSIIKYYSPLRQLETILFSNFSLVYIIVIIFILINSVIPDNKKNELLNSSFKWMTIAMVIIIVILLSI